MKQIILMLKQTLNSRAVIALVMLFSVSLPIITPSPPKAHAASLNVNTTSDTADATPGDGICADSGGDCSLRAAIRAAFERVGADTINVPTGTYTLSSNLVDYYSNTSDNALTILGANSSSTIIDGADQYSAFVFGEDAPNNEAQMVDITIKNMTVKNTKPMTGADSYSGAISINGAKATIENMVFDQNIGLGIFTVAPYDMMVYPHIGIDTTIKNVVIKSSQNFDMGGSGLGGGIVLMADGPPNRVQIDGLSIINHSVDNFYGIASFKQISGSIKNVTLANNSTSSALMGFYLMHQGDDLLDLANITIVNNSSSQAGQNLSFGPASQYGPPVRFKNILSSNNTAGGTPANCDSNATAISLGGNLSDDNTCAAVFNQPSDKNNTNPLLGSLTQDNGQYVLPLLSGSPAIDAGISSGAPATDQRGTARPQGAGVDIGAYEFMASQGDSNTATLPNSEDTQNIQITTPAGTSISCSNSLKESEQTKQDGEYTYPLGLVEFCFSGASSSNQVTTTFVTDLTPTQVKARKYNSTTNTYFDIPGATITETTLDGKHALAVTYTITDNGDLDLDPTTGSVKDPVGLAVLGATAPDTGLQRISTIPFVVAVLVGVASAVYALKLRRR